MCLSRYTRYTAMILISWPVLTLFTGIPGIPYDFRQLSVAVARAACVECLYFPSLLFLIFWFSCLCFCFLFLLFMFLFQPVSLQGVSGGLNGPLGRAQVHRSARSQPTPTGRRPARPVYPVHGRLFRCPIAGTFFH